MGGINEVLKRGNTKDGDSCSPRIAPLSLLLRHAKEHEEGILAPLRSGSRCSTRILTPSLNNT
ncbi:hypothetical protein SK128_027203 [Halocaridina rubra]|uniref:Uncharacterized protein n=1 Tax=Halocaridina rubra TaxID=373956 RepID=A0AAN8ZVJ8_HALRR